MKLINRYVSEVSKRLPLVRGRRDIERELRSTLEDMLEDRARKAGRPADEALEIELLREYGSPQKVAETYNPTPYLIGPRLFPLFITILKIVVAAVALAMTIVTGIQIATQSPLTAAALFKVIGSGLLNILSASIAAFGNLALIFALIERFAPAADIDLDDKTQVWEPSSLMREPEPEEFKSWEPILAIVVTFIAISIFNFNPQLVGIYTLTGETWTVLPVLAESFFRWLPLMNIAWAGEILLNGLLLRAGRWQVGTRAFSVAIKVLQIVIGFFLLTGPAIIAIPPDLGPETGQLLETVALQGTRSAIALVMFFIAVDIVKTVIKVVRQKA